MLASLGLAAAGGLVIAVALSPIFDEPSAVSPIVARDPVSRSPGEAPAADVSRRSAEAVESSSGVSVVRPNGEAAPGAIVIRVPDNPVQLAPAPDPRLSERTRHGILPRIGPDGARPAQVYARPAPAVAGPRIALLVGGLGISQGATAEAIAKLPPGVTLAFAPYGSDLEPSVVQARGDGHEVMLQIPMEPFDYPRSDPGPHTLTAGAKPQENIERLHWLMGRFTGYTGLVTFMGAKLTADEAALAPILKEVAGRGLLLVDDGSSTRSVIRSRPHPLGGTLRAQGVVDAVPRGDAIDRELLRLEETARERGFALGTASALSVSVERVARWAGSLEAKGIALVPVSALAEARP